MVTVSTQDTLTCTAPVLPALSDYSFHPRRAHLAVIITPRTHCHFMMQARAPRVPEVCVNHTSRSCLVAYPLAKIWYRSVNTLVLPDPWLTQEGTLAHLLLRAPFAMSQVMQCQPRSMWPLRSSHSWSLFSVATSWLLLLSLLSYQPLYHSQTLLCRPPHHVKFLRILQSRRRTSLVPCYLLTWLSRRFPTVYVPHSWMLPCRRSSHSSLSQDVSTQFGSRTVSSFSVDASLQTSTHSVVQLVAATQLDLTEFLIGWIFSDSPLDRRHPLCQSPPSVLGSHVVPLPPPGLEQPVPSPEIATHSQSLTNASSSHCPTQQPLASTTHVGTHPVRPAGAKRSASTAYAGTHNSNGSCSRTEVAPFPKPNAVILPMINFGQPKSSGPCPIATADSDYHASSISPFPPTVESRPGAQKSYQYCLCCMW